MNRMDKRKAISKKFISKRKQEKQENKPRKKQLKKRMDFMRKIDGKFRKGLKLKTELLIGVLIPIVFVILVGTLSYLEASSGFKKNAEDTARRNLEMSMSYLDFGFSLASSNMFELLLSTELNQYASGQLDNEYKEKKDIYTKLKQSLVVKAESNSFIETITIVPKSTGNIIASSDLSGEGFYEEWAISEEAVKVLQDGYRMRWIGSHPILDQKNERYSNPYAITLVGVTNNKCAAVFLDISKTTMIELLQKMCMGQGSISMYLSPDRNIVAVDSEGQEQEEGYEELLEQEFIRFALKSSDATGNQYVNYRGSTYYFAYNRLENNGSILATLVKKDTIFKNSNDIKTTSMITILIATAIACFIAFYILSNITNNMKRITNPLMKTAEGDLTVEISVSGQNEFGVIAKGIMHTLHHTRKLIGDVEVVVNTVATESEEITRITKSVSESGSNINLVINDIDIGVAQQAEDTQSCLLCMDDLSKLIEMIGIEAGKISDSSMVSSVSVKQGIEVAQQLKNHAEDTTKATSSVRQNVVELDQSLTHIEKFIQIINEIAEETNLLSLNASIEAARAGDSGRGFRVVAESIGKLADGSLDAANMIRNTVESIKMQAKDMIHSAAVAENAVQSQTKVVAITTEMFDKIKTEVDAMNSNIADIVESIKKANTERIAMVEMIESISTVSEETAACTSTVKQTVEEQVELMKEMQELIEKQNERMNELRESIHVFKL